jgi:hypothetical protein
MLLWKWNNRAHWHSFWATKYRGRINYQRISLHHNLSSKCRKIAKFVSITHSECNIWNGPIVATAISRKKRKAVLEGNCCLTFCTWPPRSPDLTVCDLFLRGFVKDNVYVPPVPKTPRKKRKAVLGGKWLPHLLHLATPVTRPDSVWFLFAEFCQGPCLSLTTSKNTTRIAKAHQTSQSRKSYETCLRGFGGTWSIAWTSAVSHVGRTSNAFKL